jgi:hypothetical protein
MADLKSMVALLKMPPRISAVHGQDDRRMFPRKEVHTSADGRRMDNTIEARQFPQLTLHLRDLSLGGLSAISPTPLAKGEKLVVFFPKQGEMGGWDAMGRVVRCDQSTLGYRVALEFDPLLAA